MAEVIGVLSSVITFTTVIAQVTNSIILIKDCWSQFRDAPDDLQYLMRDLEMFGLILAEIEEDLSKKDLAFALKDSKHAMQSLKFSREAGANLQALSEDILRDMHCTSLLRKSYAAAKAVMQRGKIERHMARLRNAIQLLSLSQQCYTRALIRVQPDLIAEKLVQGKNNTSNFKPIAHPLESQSRGETPDLLHDPTEGASQGEMSHNAHTFKYPWRLSLPPWLCTKALSVYSERQCHGWQWVFRTYNVVPPTSEVVYLTIAGEVEDLQKLFATRQASPFDRTGNNFTLLHYAVLGPRKEKVLKFLLEQGVDSSIGSIYPKNDAPLDMLVSCGTLALDEGGSLFPSLRLLLRYTRQFPYEDTPEEANSGVLSRFHGSSEEFKFLQQNCCPSYYEMPQETRIAVACRAISGVWDGYHMPDLIQTMLGPDTMTAQDLQLEGPWRFDSKNTTLVHCVVRKIGVCQAALQGQFPCRRRSREAPPLGHSLILKKKKENLDLYRSWVTLFVDFLQAGVDLNHVVDQQTLLLVFFEGYFDWSENFQYQILSPTGALQNWLTDLKGAGIDLQKFGEIEDSIWKREPVRRDFSAGDLWSRDLWNRSYHRLIGFSYGPSIADWSVWLSPNVDVFVGEFWHLVEKPVEMMAGGWPCD